MIIIAHRLNTIREVDKIFVVNEGKIESSGTHNELLVNSLIYHSMWQASSKED